ncbi:hypothetical protein Tbon_10680 [Tepidiforma bonchosmolovskayae]|uniref:Uncharacterized protein n=1 Tax=Tepidiforma bonchosmolovskayae TaxID=2601677 RepID=A0ABX6C5J7_9CHLR|nr:hypothetical protein Tbon_10680 [Tepidiforma bonchosmolovskayae]
MGADPGRFGAGRPGGAAARAGRAAGGGAGRRRRRVRRAGGVVRGGGRPPSAAERRGPKGGRGRPDHRGAEGVGRRRARGGDAADD